MQKSQNWGGRRSGSGRPRRHFTYELDRKTARRLTLLTKDRRFLVRQPNLTESDVLAWLVNRECDDIFHEEDELAQRNAEVALQCEEEYLYQEKKKEEREQ